MKPLFFLFLIGILLTVSLVWHLLIRTIWLANSPVPSANMNSVLIVTYSSMKSCITAQGAGVELGNAEGSGWLQWDCSVDPWVTSILICDDLPGD